MIASTLVVFHHQTFGLVDGGVGGDWGPEKSFGVGGG
jgi:hypothetical protein